MISPKRKFKIPGHRIHSIGLNLPSTALSPNSIHTSGISQSSRLDYLAPLIVYKNIDTPVCPIIYKQ